VNAHENTHEDLSHATAVQPNLVASALSERDQLRAYVRRALGLQRDLQTLLGGTLLAELIEDGELALEGRRGVS